MIVATGKPDSLRQSYGHWTGVVRRSRLGIVMAAASDLDGDLVGVDPAAAHADPGAARVGVAGQRRRRGARPSRRRLPVTPVWTQGIHDCLLSNPPDFDKM